MAKSHEVNISHIAVQCQKIMDLTYGMNFQEEGKCLQIVIAWMESKICVRFTELALLIFNELVYSSVGFGFTASKLLFRFLQLTTFCAMPKANPCPTNHSDSLTGFHKQWEALQNKSNLAHNNQLHLSVKENT